VRSSAIVVSVGCVLLRAMRSRGFFTDITRARDAHDVRVRVCVRMCVRAHVCARVHDPPPQKKDPP